MLTGDRRLVDRLGHRDLRPLDSCILRRLLLDTRSPHLLEAAEAAGNTSLMTSEAKVAVAEHAASNYRSMIGHGDELFSTMLDVDTHQIDEDPFFDQYKRVLSAGVRERSRWSTWVAPS